MLIELLSIIVFTFAFGLLLLGLVTWWVETDRRRAFGAAMVVVGFLIATSYAFLGSRFAIRVFGRLIITVDLPRLMMTAIVHTLGVMGGLGLAGLLFLWVSRSFVKPTRRERQMVIFLAVVLLVALLLSFIAVWLG
ncbi:MAG: hypothetical protein ACLFU8_00015 [Anaerolineales bacterium]